MIDLVFLIENSQAFLLTPAGAVSFVICYGIWVAFLLPASWLTMLGGFLYGPFLGSMLVFIGAFLGAEATFFMTRVFFQERAQKRVSNYPKLNKLKNLITKEGIKLIVLSRLSPLFPFSILNLLYGLSEVTIKDFSFGLLAIIPGTFLYCKLGSFASQISGFSELLNNKSTSDSLFLSILGLIATFLIVWIISQAAQRSFKDIDSSID